MAIARRVVFVLPHFEAGGIERVVLNLLIHLDRSRFSPALVLFRRGGDLLEQVPAEVPILDLGGRRARDLVLPLVRTLRDLGPAVVYTGTCAANIVTLLATRLMRPAPPVIVSEHSPVHLSLADQRLRALRVLMMRLIYPHAASVAVPMGVIGDELRRILRRPNLPITHVPNPVVALRPHSPPVRPAPGSGAPGPRFVAAGRLVPAKGFDVLIAAFAMLREGIPSATLTIYGEGVERASLEALCRRLGVADAVRLPGFVPDPLSSADPGTVFVLSSRREGFGNVLIEAMAQGMPIVATDCPVGPRAVLEGGRFGLLVPPESPQALCDGMRRVATDHDLAARLTAGAVIGASRYEVTRATGAYAALFDRAADAGQRDRNVIVET